MAEQHHYSIQDTVLGCLGSLMPFRLQITATTAAFSQTFEATVDFTRTTAGPELGIAVTVACFRSLHRQSSQFQNLAETIVAE